MQVEVGQQFITFAEQRTLQKLLPCITCFPVSPTYALSRYCCSETIFIVPSQQRQRLIDQWQQQQPQCKSSKNIIPFKISADTEDPELTSGLLPKENIQPRRHTLNEIGARISCNLHFPLKTPLPCLLVFKLFLLFLDKGFSQPCGNILLTV